MGAEIVADPAALGMCVAAVLLIMIIAVAWKDR